MPMFCVSVCVYVCAKAAPLHACTHTHKKKNLDAFHVLWSYVHFPDEYLKEEEVSLVRLKAT